MGSILIVVVGRDHQLGILNGRGHTDELRQDENTKKTLLVPPDTHASVQTVQRPFLFGLWPT